MRPTSISALRPCVISSLAIGLGMISSSALGFVTTPSSAGTPPRSEAKSVEFIATTGGPVVVIDGERHAGEVHLDEASGMMVLVDGEGEIRRFPIPAAVLGRTNVDDRDDRDDRDEDEMGRFAREMEARIREMIADRFGEHEDGVSMDFDFAFDVGEDDQEGFDERDHEAFRERENHPDHQGDLWEEMLMHVHGMMEEAHHETAGWMEEMAGRSGHWAEEAEHRLHEFAEMTDHRMHEFAEMADERMNEFAKAFEHELQRVIERQEQGRRETEMMFRERDLDLRERGMEFQRSLGESGRNLQETLRGFAEQHQRLAEENRRLNERVGRLEQMIRRMMSEGGPDRDREDDDRMRGGDSEDAQERSAERGRRGAERNGNRNDRRDSDAGSERDSDRPRSENRDRSRDRGGDRD